MFRIVTLLFSHGLTLAIGFALGIYLLPILTAEQSPDSAVLQQQSKDALHTAELTRDLKGSDFLHWGEGKISVSPTKIVHEGKLSPGPDFKVYLMKKFAENEAEFLAVKDQAVQVGSVKSFEGFILDVPQGVNVDEFNTVLVWCERFGEFITAAKYR